MVKRGPLLGHSSIRRRSAAWTIAGLDVSVKETSICIVDDTGRIVREVKVASEPLLQVLGNPIYRFERIEPRNCRALLRLLSGLRHAPDCCAGHRAAAEGDPYPRTGALHALQRLLASSRLPVKAQPPRGAT